MKQCSVSTQTIAMLRSIGMYSKEDLRRLQKIQKAQQFCQYLLRHGITYDFCIKHGEVLGCLESDKYYQRFQDYLGEDYVICKNLLLQERKGDRQKFLLITNSQKKVDLASVRETIGSRKLEFVGEEEMHRVIDATPGNVSLFSIMNDSNQEVKLVIDEELLDASRLAFHPLYNGMSIFLQPKACFKFLNMIGREAMIVPIAEKELEKAKQKILA